MNSRRFSLRFDLDHPEEKAAWDFIHRKNIPSVRHLIIEAINFYRQNQDLPNMIRSMSERIQAGTVPFQQVQSDDDQTVWDFLDGM